MTFYKTPKFSTRYRLSIPIIYTYLFGVEYNGVQIQSGSKKLRAEYLLKNQKHTFLIVWNIFQNIIIIKSR